MHKIDERPERKQLLVRTAPTPEQPAVLVSRDCVLAQPQRGSQWFLIHLFCPAFGLLLRLTACCYLIVYFQWLPLSMCFLNVANAGVSFLTLLTHTFCELMLHLVYSPSLHTSPFLPSLIMVGKSVTSVYFSGTLPCLIFF